MQQRQPDIAFLDELIRTHEEHLGDNDRAFLRRAYSTDPEIYRQRLRAIAFNGLDHILDAGCGFGQWTLALADLNNHVSSLDAKATRIDVLNDILARFDIHNVTTHVGRIEEVPYPDAAFDAVFCYIAIFYAGWLAALDEIVRVLKPGGRLYVTGNGIGWHLHLWFDRPNAAADYEPREIVCRAFADTVEYERSGRPPATQLIVEPEAMIEAVEQRGLTVLARGDEGTIHVNRDTPAPQPFFAGSYHGHTGCYEILAQKEAPRS